MQVDLTLTTAILIDNDKIANVLIVMFADKAQLAWQQLLLNNIINFDNSDLCLIIIDKSLFLALKPCRDYLTKNNKFTSIECRLPTIESVELQQLIYTANNLALPINLTLQFIAQWKM